MATLTKEELVDLLKNSPLELLSTHGRLSFPVINRMYKKMRGGVKFKPIEIAENSIITNGHHRYLASLVAKVSLERVPCHLTQAKVQTKWELVELVDDDWDTPFDIEKFNAEDAKFSEMPLNELVELLK